MSEGSGAVVAMGSGRRLRSWVRVRRLAVGLALMTACASSPSTQPRTLGSFVDALDRRDYPVAYGLMSKAYRAHTSAAAFADEAGRISADERQALRRAAQRSEGGAAPGMWVAEGTSWRLDALPVPSQDSRTPRGALHAFLAAIEGRRWDLLLRLLPAEQRDGTTPELLAEAWGAPDRAAQVQPVLRDLALGADAPIDEQGDRALLVVSGGSVARVIRFVRESGSWKIESID